MDPHHARKPARCDVTRLDGLPDVYELRRMEWIRWGPHAVGQGLVNGRAHPVRLKRARPCGEHGEVKAYSRMSIDGRPFRPILYCGD